MCLGSGLDADRVRGPGNETQPCPSGRGDELFTVPFNAKQNELHLRTATHQGYSSQRGEKLPCNGGREGVPQVYSQVLHALGLEQLCCHFFDILACVRFVC